MYETISTELFSSLIDKINKIANYSTTYKENTSIQTPYQISKLIHLYNMEYLHKDAFSKILSQIRDNSLKQNLIKIMINIGIKYNSFSVTNDNSTLIKEANDELMSLFSLVWNYFNQKGEYLKNMNINNSNLINREINEYESCFKETVCFTCGLINIVIFMFKKQYSILDYFNKNLNLNSEIKKINLKSNKEYIQMEINMLFIIHKNRIWLEPLITLLEQIFKFIISNNFYKFISTKLDKYKKKEKEGEMSKEEIIQKIDSYIDYIVDDKEILKTIFTVVTKFNSLNNINVIIGSIIPISELNAVIQRFFNIYIVFLMNKNIIKTTSNDEQIYCLGINLINCLLNSKYKDKNYGVDFMGYFYGAQKFFDEIFDEINIKIINGLNDLISYLKAGCLNIQMPNLNLLQNLENSLKDYTMYSLIACYNKDSLCDCFLNCEKQRQLFTSFGLVRSYLFICKSINKSLNGILNNENMNINFDVEKRRQIIIQNIFYDLLKELKKYNIALPVKIFLHKNYILQCILAVLHTFVKMFYKEILSANTDKFMFYNDISFIKDLSESINSLFFLLGKDILYYLKFPSNKKNSINEYYYTPYSMPYLRIIDEANPIDYYSIAQTKMFNPTFRTSRSNTIKFTAQIYDGDNDNDKENNNIYGNSFILPKTNDNIITSALFKSSLNNNNHINDKYEYTIMPTNTFQSNISRTVMKKKKGFQISEYFYRYDITSIAGNFKKDKLLLLSKLGFEYRIENNHHYIYINTEDNNNFNYSQVIHLLKNDVSSISLNNSSLYNILKNELFSSQIIEKLYMNLLEGFDESNKGKNCENSFKYYDINFNMDYFTFVERCKENTIREILGEGFHCSNDDEMEEMFALRGALHFYFIDNYIDVLNYKNPNTKYFYRVENGIDKDNYSINHLNLNPTTIITSNGLFFENIQKENGYIYDRNDVFTYATQDSEIYMAYYLWLGNRMFYYQRIYKRVQDIASQIGGIAQAVLITAFYISHFYNRYIVISDTNELLSYIDEENSSKYTRKKIKPLQIVKNSSKVNNAKIEIPKKEKFNEDKFKYKNNEIKEKNELTFNQNYPTDINDKSKFFIYFKTFVLFST